MNFRTLQTLVICAMLLLLASWGAVNGQETGSIVGWGGHVYVEPSALMDIVAISGSTAQTLAIKSDGSIVAWGSNSAGECIVPEPNESFVACAAGITNLNFGVCFGLKEDGTLLSWGDGGVGIYDMDGISAISANRDYFLTLTTDSMINIYGEYSLAEVPEPNADFIAISTGTSTSLGLKSDSTIVVIDGPELVGENASFIAIAAGGSHSLGLKADGSITAWGNNTYGECDVPGENGGFVAIAAGSNHSLGLRSDGSIEAWGRNRYGQCTIPEPNEDFVKIAANVKISMCIKSDGTAMVWGRNFYGACNVPVPNEGFTQIAQGSSHSLALRVDSTIVAWGSTHYEQCNVPGGNDFKTIAAGVNHSLALRSDGMVEAWGDNGAHQCDIGYVVGDGPIIDIDGGQYHSAVLTEDGSIRIHGGSSIYGPPSNGDFTAIASGYGHCLGLTSNGSILAWGGDNNYGECDVPNEHFVAIAAGSYHSLGLKNDGSIAAWGKDTSGQCSDLPDPNIGFVDIAAGSQFSAGLKADGTIVTWGLPEKYEVPSPNERFIAVAAKGGVCLGLKTPDLSPVSLSSFTLESYPGHMKASWELAVPSATGEFRFVGSKGDQSWEVEYSQVNEQQFIAVDHSQAVRDGGVIVYALYGCEHGEDWLLLRSESLTINGVPAKHALLGAFPNPFNPHTTISFSVGTEGPIRITVHDVTGRLIAQLFDGQAERGEHVTTWLGRNLSGQNVASGLYFVRMQTVGYSASKKLVLLR